MGAIDTIEWACVLCGHHIQNDWVSRAMNLHHISHEAWTFSCGNYSDDSEGRSYGQLVIGSFIMTTCLLMHHVLCSFLAKHQMTQVTQPLYSPDLAPCDFWLFPKLKSLLKSKRFQTVKEIQENKTGQLMAIGRTVWGPKVPTLKGTEATLSYVQCLLSLGSSSINISIFHITWLNTFWTDLIYKIKYNT